MTGFRLHRGFSLIEVLVGMLIAMIATIVIFQVFSVSERQKRTTTGTSDAQGNGAIGIATLARDVKAAGWGLVQSSFRCSSIFTYDSTAGGPIDSTGGTSLFQAANITEGDTNGADSISILLYGTPSDSTFELGVGTLTSATTTPSAALQMTTTSGCAPGYLAIISDANNCSLMQVSAMTGTSLSHDPGGTNGRYNPPAPTTWPNYGLSTNVNPTSIQCFPRLFRRTFQLANEQLEVVDDGIAYPIVPGIVDLQAQYGIHDTSMKPPIRWVTATDPWKTPVIADIRRIAAVRIAILARNGEFQKPSEGSTTCDATSESMAASWSTWAKFNTGTFQADWQCYRYKEFETVIPLRNVIWAGF